MAPPYRKSPGLSPLRATLVAPPLQFILLSIVQYRTQVLKFMQKGGRSNAVEPRWYGGEEQRSGEASAAAECALNQYVNPNHSKLQQKWDDFKKDPEGAKRVWKTITEKNVVDETDDDDMVIRNWKNCRDGLKSTEKRKVGMLTTRLKKWCGGEDQEWKSSRILVVVKVIKKGKESEEEEEEANLKGNSVNMIFEPENSEPSSQSPSLPYENSSDDTDETNVGGKQGKRCRLSRNGRVSDEIRANAEEDDRDNRDGVKMWLNQLGLCKYASLFEVHEVDDEVFPFLTLEDLKDVGIRAVGPRRKMFCSIQKLGNKFS